MISLLATKLSCYVILCYDDDCCIAVEETSNAMALDGIMFEGVSVRVRRPNDYNPAAAAALGPSVPNPALNLGAIGLQPGGMGAQVTTLKSFPVQTAH